MEAGPDGFIIGRFGEHVVVLDAPNLMLTSIKKRPAAENKSKKGNKMKKPAAAADVDVSCAEEQKKDDHDVELWDKPKQVDLTAHTHTQTYVQAICVHMQCALRIHHA